ncbi:MAG: hypothetical protein MUC48_02095 [Leptolyngbya sp. Prado105]|jgi:hypothetical protein|nr:hypothetical protein [Leptolyngbya sp. Prado105]
MHRYLYVLSLAVSLLVNLLSIKSAIATSNLKIEPINPSEISDENRLKSISEISEDSPVIAQVINPPPSEIIVPPPLDEPEINQPPQPPDLKPPELPKPSEPPKPTIADPEVSKKLLNAIILNAIGNSSKRFPWLVNPASNLLESTTSFTPAKTENYTDIDIQYRDNQLLIREFDAANFPKSDQFYWVLPKNRIVIETRGWQAGIDYQGQERTLEIDQRIRLTQALWGLQAVWSLPQPFQDLYGRTDTSQFTIQAISGEVSNPVGVAAPPVIINNTTLSPTAIRIAPPPRLGTGSSNNSNGGGSLFQFLEAENAPLILQAYPTSNLQPLMEAEGLFVGAKIPPSVLEAARIGWKNPFTGEGQSTAPVMSSAPGIKVGQLGKFDNLDLLNLLVNPSLDSTERTLAYLNSLFWIPLGQRKPDILRTRVTQQDELFWHRLSLNQPHNRTLLQYDAVRPQATYTNVFANPGFSLSFSMKKGQVNDLQSLNSSLGLLLGGVFSFIRPQDLTQSLTESRDRYDRREAFSGIVTKATSNQRVAINQRLNRGLYYANTTSGLRQISGTFTFPSIITPTHAELFQIRAGNQRRLARFLQVESTWIPGNTYFSRLELSNRDFGQLSFIGMPVNSSLTGLTSNRSSATQVVIQAPDGQEFVQDFSSSSPDPTVVPIGIRSSDIAFDRIEFTQFGRGKTQTNRFEGYLFLPAVEAMLAGSSGKWNYAVNTGVWFNLNGDAAFEVARNNLGDPEPSVGVYLNSLINHIDTRVVNGSDGKAKAIVNLIPSLRLSWSSVPNASNPAYLNLSYTYTRQQRQLNYSITPGFFLSYSSDRLAPVGFFQGQLGFKRGLEFRSSLELNSQFFYSLEASQRLSAIWSAGFYVQNYRSTESLINRESAMSYGIILRNRSAKQGFDWRSRFGMSGNQLEIRLEGGYQF